MAATMPPLLPRNNQEAAGNDRPSEYAEAVEDFWRDLEVDRPQETTNTINYVQEPTTNIDEEIKITRKRKPVAKLDAERLLSDRGIPELKRRAGKRLKLHGKGSEFEDIGKLLQMYQLWLDDMYPKAKFRDGLAMVEKIGHTKRLNVMRKAWMTATRPRQPSEEPDDFIRAADETSETSHLREHAHSNSQADPDQGVEHAQSNSQAGPDQGVEHAPTNAPDEDELDALLAQENGQQLSEPIVKPMTGNPFGEDSDEDDLDALLGEEAADTRSHDAERGHQPSTNYADDQLDDFADDEEAMHEMGIW